MMHYSRLFDFICYNAKFYHIYFKVVFSSPILTQAGWSHSTTRIDFLVRFFLFNLGDWTKLLQSRQYPMTKSPASKCSTDINPAEIKTYSPLFFHHSSLLNSFGTRFSCSGSLGSIFLF